MSVIYTMKNISRRSLLVGGAGWLGGYLAASPLQGLAQPAADQTQLAEFMRLSQLLVNHKLNEQVGARIFRYASKTYAGLPSLGASIVAVAERKRASIVEDFFDDIPEGAAKELAHWIIFAWYTGGSSAKPDAQVFTYEQALTYKTTRDVLPIPSYGLSGPNQWRQVTIALSPLPQF